MEEQGPVKIPVRDKRKINDQPDGPSAPEEDLSGADATSNEEVVEASIEETDTSSDDAKAYLEDLQRLKADFDNYRKRVMKDQTALIESATRGLVGRLLGVLDNFDLAVGAAEETRDFDRMLKGIEMVFGELKEVLKAEGLQPIVAKGHTFDPNLHEAAVEVPGDDSGVLVVAEVLRPGYMFKGRVIRPAMVKVIQKKGEASAPEPIEG